MDFAKAKVCNCLVLHRLHHCGVQGKTNRWIQLQAFLSGRSQVVATEGFMSDSVSVQSGVSQGPVLGPSLFLYYMIISYQVTGECTRTQGPGRSRMITPMQDRFLVLLFLRNHKRTAKALEIDFCRATEVHLPDQIVSYRLHYDVMRARRSDQGQVLTVQHRAVRFNFVRQHQN